MRTKGIFVVQSKGRNVEQNKKYWMHEAKERPKVMEKPLLWVRICVCMQCAQFKLIYGGCNESLYACILEKKELYRKHSKC